MSEQGRSDSALALCTQLLSLGAELIEQMSEQSARRPRMASLLEWRCVAKSRERFERAGATRHVILGLLGVPVGPLPCDHHVLRGPPCARQHPFGTGPFLLCSRNANGWLTA